MTALSVPRLPVRARRLPAILFVAAAGVVMTPAPARAHAHLRRSAPAAGSSVAAPQAIRLWFTEAPELTLTRITLLDSTGASVTTTAPEIDAEGTMGLRVRIDRVLPPGRYTVRWSTAAADGHPSSGSFSFRVAAPAGAAAAVTPTDSAGRAVGSAPMVAPRTAAAPPTPADVSHDADSVRPAAVLTRAAWLAAIVVLLGAVTFRLFVLSRSDAFDVDAGDDAAAKLADRALLAGAVFLAATIVRLYLQGRMMADQLPTSAPLRVLTMDTRWGLVWRMQFGAGVLALVGLLVARRRLPVGWGVTAVAAVLIALGAALGGHAGAADQFTSFAVADDTLHVLGASGWLGGLFWVVAVGMFPLRDVSDDSTHRIATLVRSFSPVALWCAGLAALSGVASAWLRIGSISALATTSYGQVLVLKLALVAAAAGFGFYNWRHLRPALGSDPATARLRRSATRELVVAGAIVLVTAVLVGLPTPVPGMR